MKNATTYKVVFGCIITLFCYTLSAQNMKTSSSNTKRVNEVNKRIANYQKLISLGYTDKEAFQDLGNANFILKKYETAVFWYKKLVQVSKEGVIGDSYNERFQYALIKTGGTAALSVSDHKDWESQIKADYQIKERSSEHKLASSSRSKYKELDFQQKRESFIEDQILAGNKIESSNSEKLGEQNAYDQPLAVTADGRTAYFSKAIYEKPLYGIFSKKELVHKIFKADKVNGEWKNIKEVAVCPKNFSALHPTISDDGKRLFYASDMPGTFGKYDIYVSNIRKDGTLGIAMNLGEKVNTKKNDLYPNAVGENTLFYASSGHKGYGGLDVFMVQVGQKKVGWSVNLGDAVNSKHDDFSIFLMKEKGEGYVMSNRGKNKDVVQSVAFSYSNKNQNKLEKDEQYNFLAAFSSDIKVDYTTSVFEDE